MEQKTRQCIRCKKYKPINVLKVIYLGNIDFETARHKETLATLYMMKKHGWQNVRGAKWLKENIVNPFEQSVQNPFENPYQIPKPKAKAKAKRKRKNRFDKWLQRQESIERERKAFQKYETC